MKAILWSMMALLAIGPANRASAQQTRVLIDLSEQRAYLMEGGRVSLVAPISSGKPGWSPLTELRVGPRRLRPGG